MGKRDSRERRSVDQLRQMRVAFEDRQRAQAERRRTEDQIREELRDSRAKTIKPTRSKGVPLKRRSS
jgi:hypothetical protein